MMISGNVAAMIPSVHMSAPPKFVESLKRMPAAIPRIAWRIDAPARVGDCSRCPPAIDRMPMM